MPLPLKPAPEVVICEMVRFALPVLLTEIDCVPLLPTVTLPKPTLVRFGVSCATGAAAPVPVSAMVVGELKAFVMSDTVPLYVPVAAAGAKVNVKEVLAPAAKLKGRASPLAL